MNRLEIPRIDPKVLDAILMTILIAGAAAARTIFLFKDDFATGFDGYFYALQVRSLVENGRILNHDTSIVYRLLWLFHFVFKDIVLSNKIAVIVLCSTVVVPFYLISKRCLNSALTAFFSSLIFILSFSQIYMTFEIVKNGVGIVFLVWALYFLSRFDDGRQFQALSIVFGILSFMTHKVTGGIFALVAGTKLTLIAAVYFRNKRDNPKVILSVTFAIAAGLIVLILAGIRVFRLSDISHLLSSIALDSPLERTKLILFHISNIRIKFELIALHLIPLFFVPVLVNTLKDSSVDRQRKELMLSIFITHLTLVFPFLDFNWVSIAYRFLLCSIIMAALELGLIIEFCIAKFKKKSTIYTFATMAVIAVFFVIGLHGMYQRFHYNRYPDYKKLFGTVMKIPGCVNENTRLIAYFGLSYFVWYSTGIYTQHFVADSEIDRYYRIVYGIGPVHFTEYIENSATDRIFDLGAPFCLVPEMVWQRYYIKNGERLKLLSSWMNPYEKRPEFVYYFKDL